MARYDFAQQQDRFNIEAFGSDVIDAIVITEGNGFTVRVETAQDDFFAIPHTSHADAADAAERLLSA